jgi:hypothetical protein
VLGRLGIRRARSRPRMLADPLDANSPHDGCWRLPWLVTVQ